VNRAALPRLSEHEDWRRALSEPMSRLDGFKVLVVEDDSLIAASVCFALEELGAEVVGPAASVEEALSRLASVEVDGAVLDVNLGAELVYPVADRMIEQQVPFLFCTSFPVFEMPIRYWHLPRQDKPYCGSELAKRLAAMCDMSAKTTFPPFLGPNPDRERHLASA
jgi:DNA-binding response OmpR family regulator